MSSPAGFDNPAKTDRRTPIRRKDGGRIASVSASELVPPRGRGYLDG